MKKHLNLLVSGRVQRVGYRFSCMEAAYKYNIRGSVRNKRDGSVYIEAEGVEKDLNEFIIWCRKGPVWARVTDVSIDAGEVINYDSFEISR